jgi:hypothetical protein
MKTTDPLKWRWFKGETRWPRRVCSVGHAALIASPWVQPNPDLPYSPRRPNKVFLQKCPCYGRFQRVASTRNRYRSESRRREACPSMRPARAPDFYVFMSGQRGAFSAMRRISAAPQSRPWCARRGGTGHSAHQERRRYRLRRSVIDVEPDQSQIKTV